MGFKSWIRQRKKSKKNDLSSDAESNPRSALKVEDVKSGQENEPELDTPGTRLESVGEVKENTEVEPDVPPPTAFKDGFPVPDTKSDKDDSAATAEEPVTALEPEPRAPASPPPQRTPAVPEEEEEDKAEIEDRTAEGPNVVEQKEPAKYRVHAHQLLYVFGAAYVLFVMAVVKLFGVSLWNISWYAILAAPVGLGYSWLRSVYIKRKKAAAGHLNCMPGIKGLAALLGQQPTWLQYTDKEKVEFLNKVTAKAWPYYDKAVCTSIKEIVEPIMEEMKPAGISRIGFQKLTFGDVPVRIEGVCVDKDEDEIRLNIDYRWCGDASIVLAVELITESTRWSPKITDIQVVGSVRIVLKPLVDVIPGFGAILVTKDKPPKLKFHLDFGKALGGGVVGGGARAVINSFMKDIWTNLLVWPRRIIVPILDESITGPLDYLQLRSVGLLTVVVVKGSNLPRADSIGSSDPEVILYTEMKRQVKTTVKKNTLDPVWDEAFFLFIQEPMSQNLYLTVNDVDMVNIKEVVTLNVIKGIKDSVGARETLGRAIVPVKLAAAEPGTESEHTFSLGPDDFSDDNGPGTGCGTITLKLTYQPFEDLQAESATKGAVIVSVIQCRNLVAKDRGGTSDPYVVVKIREDERKTQVIPTSLNPEFNETFEFFDPRPGHCVNAKDTLKVRVFDKDFVSDDLLGKLDLPVSHIAKSRSDVGSPGVCRKWFPLADTKHGDIELSVQFIPFA